MKRLREALFQLKPFDRTTMKPKLILSLVFVVALGTSIFAQPTTVFTEANLAYKRGMDFYDKGIYSLAMQEFYVALTQLRPAPEPEARLLRGLAELHYAKSAVRSGQPNGEQLMLDYIRTYSPDPLAGQAAIEMGDFYFNQNKLEKALDFYNAMQASELPANQRDELYFKQGYCYFVQKKFPQAKGNLSKVKEKHQRLSIITRRTITTACVHFLRTNSMMQHVVSKEWLRRNNIQHLCLTISCRFMLHNAIGIKF